MNIRTFNLHISYFDVAMCEPEVNETTSRLSYLDPVTVAIIHSLIIFNDAQSKPLFSTGVVLFSVPYGANFREKTSEIYCFCGLMWGPECHLNSPPFFIKTIWGPEKNHHPIFYWVCPSDPKLWHYGSPMQWFLKFCWIGGGFQQGSVQGLGVCRPQRMTRMVSAGG